MLWCLWYRGYHVFCIGWIPNQSRRRSAELVSYEFYLDTFSKPSSHFVMSFSCYVFCIRIWNIFFRYPSIHVIRKVFWNIRLLAKLVWIHAIRIIQFRESKIILFYGNHFFCSSKASIWIIVNNYQKLRFDIYLCGYIFHIIANLVMLQLCSLLANTMVHKFNIWVKLTKKYQFSIPNAM